MSLIAVISFFIFAHELEGHRVIELLTTEKSEGMVGCVKPLNPTPNDL